MVAVDGSTLSFASEEGIECHLGPHFVGRLRASLESGVTRGKEERTRDDGGGRRGRRRDGDGDGDG